MLISNTPKEKTLLIWNKIDLPSATPIPLGFTNFVCISAKEGTGLDTLRKQIDRLIWQDGPPAKEEVIITSIRHHQALMNAIFALQALIDGLKTGISPEFVSSDVRKVLTELGMIIGTNITEDILSAIFSKFCIGK